MRRALRGKPKHNDRVLSAIVDTRGANAECNPLGGVVHFENDFFEGCAFFAHKPPAGVDTPFEYTDLLASRGEPLALWELQIQGRFKTKPAGTAFVGFELWDGPMEVGLLTRAICGTIILFGTGLAKQRGMEIRCSFGSSNGDPPGLVFPLAGADRILVSDKPVQLPIGGGGGRGVWHMDGDEKWANVDRASLTFAPGPYHTFIFASGIIDMNAWTVCGIPGIGCLDLEQFWCKQALHVVMFDDGGEDKKDKQGVGNRRTFFEMQFHAPVAASSTSIAAAKSPLPLSDDSVQLVSRTCAHCDVADFPTDMTRISRQVSPEVALSNQPDLSTFDACVFSLACSSDWLASSEVVHEYPDFIRI